MNKQDIISEIAATSSHYYPAGLNRAQVEAALNCLADIARNHLVKPGAEMSLPGIGKLKAVTKAARTGRNPATGAQIVIPAHTAVRLVTGKALKDAIG
jgi:DNA-binding protein HU-beta